MSDLKSKIPDINEITAMAGKLFKDVKKSVTEIIADYKANHPTEEIEKTKEPKSASAKKSKSSVADKSGSQTKSSDKDTK